jgi:hypothetical protein
LSSLQPRRPSFGFFPDSYFHVGLVVEELEPAIDELKASLGLSFTPPSESEYGGTVIRVAYSRPEPPFIELVQGAPGSPWDTRDGSHVDHVGYFSTDLDVDAAALEAAGLTMAIDGRVHGSSFTYHSGKATGMRVELIDVGQRDRLLKWILGD